MHVLGFRWQLEKIQQMEALKRAGLVTRRRAGCRLLDYKQQTLKKGAHAPLQPHRCSQAVLLRYSKVNMLVGLNEYRFEQRTIYAGDRRLSTRSHWLGGPMKSGGSPQGPA